MTPLLFHSLRLTLQQCPNVHISVHWTDGECFHRMQFPHIMHRILKALPASQQKDSDRFVDILCGLEIHLIDVAFDDLAGRFVRSKDDFRLIPTRACHSAKALLHAFASSHKHMPSTYFECFTGSFRCAFDDQDNLEIIFFRQNEAFFICTATATHHFSDKWTALSALTQIVFRSVFSNPSLISLYFREHEFSFIQ